MSRSGMLRKGIKFLPSQGLSPEPLDWQSSKLTTRPPLAPYVTWIQKESESRGAILTIFDLADVTNDKVTNRNLDNFASTYRCKLVLMLDLALKSTKLPFLPPVVERSHEDHNKNSNKNGDSFDPPCLRLALVVSNQFCEKGSTSSWPSLQLLKHC